VTETRNFTSIHNHSEISNYRFQDSTIRIEELIDRALELDYSGVAITDHEALSGHVRFLHHYYDLKKNGTLPSGFKAILGNEIYLIDSMEDVTVNYQPSITRYWHFILLAKDEIGYKQVRQISSESAWENYFRQGLMERVPTLKSDLEHIIGQDKGHLIASSACLGGQLPYLCTEYFTTGDSEIKLKIHKFVTWCTSVFGKENFYIELQPASDSESEQSQSQMFANQCLLKIAKAYGLKWIVTTDSHYLKKEHRGLHEAYLNSDSDKGFGSRESGDFYETTYMMSKDELFSMLANHISEEDAIAALENTNIIYNSVEMYDLDAPVVVPRDPHTPLFQVEHLFKNWYDKCPYIEKFAYSEDVQERYFLYLVEQGFKKKLQPMDKEHIKRINTEMSEIWEISEKMGSRMASYYTLVRAIIHEIMWKVSYVGVARGSTTGFYTAYLLEISQMNPLTYDLPHWRHLSAFRPDYPDIDVDTEKSKRADILNGMREYFGKDNVLNTLTQRTEGSKSATLTACRGLGIDNDTAQGIADLIPFERGKNWSLNDCFCGDEEKDRKPVTEFVNLVAQYSGLKDMMLQIEGIICGRGIHASAVYIFDNGYLEKNSRMRAPNGEYITAFSMYDSNDLGALKFDNLTIAALDKLHTTVDLLCKQGIIEAQPTIKETYDKYLHPDVLDYDDPNMWDLVCENRLMDAFQFETVQGIQAAKTVKPHSITELATANTLMRLMADDGEEQPIDTYVRNKQNIDAWYQEMMEFGLSEDEINLINNHLLSTYGIADSQESVMKLSMDEHISNFTIGEANLLRKSIAKKSVKALAEAKTLFFSKGKSQGTSDKMLDYVWNVQFKKSFGYSFSLCHTAPYSCICLQEMNLAYHYSRLCWNTACLTVNAGADEDSENNSSTQYGKIAKAVGKIQSYGQVVELPDINKVKFGFSPDMQADSIVFSLKGVKGIGDDVAKAIIYNQPYASLQDFIHKINEYKATHDNVKISDGTIITLIKAGCFDSLENQPRENILKKFLSFITPPKKSLTLKDIPLLYKYGLLSPEQELFELRIAKFQAYVCSKQFLVKSSGKSASTNYYQLESRFALPFFYEHYEALMTEGKDYEQTLNGVIVKRGSLERVTKALLQTFKERVLTSPSILEAVNEHRNIESFNALGSTNISAWEMDTLSFYFHEHELANVNHNLYNLSDFKTIAETPEVVEYRKRGEKTYPRFRLYKICGTVLDKNKNKHIVSILTTSGVVDVKFYKGQFVFYDRQLSEIGEDGKKTVVEKSWFSRGNKLIITGIRRGDQFAPRKYSDSAYRHTVQLVTAVHDDGTMDLQSERTGYEND